MRKRIMERLVSTGIQEDPIKSHDGMDINPFSGVVESSGYGFREEVIEEGRESFERGLENQKATRRSRDDWER